MAHPYYPGCPGGLFSGGNPPQDASLRGFIEQTALQCATNPGMLEAIRSSASSVPSSNSEKSVGQLCYHFTWDPNAEGYQYFHWLLSTYQSGSNGLAPPPPPPHGFQSYPSHFNTNPSYIAYGGPPTVGYPPVYGYPSQGVTHPMMPPQSTGIYPPPGRPLIPSDLSHHVSHVLHAPNPPYTLPSPPPGFGPPSGPRGCGYGGSFDTHNNETPPTTPAPCYAPGDGLQQPPPPPNPPLEDIAAIVRRFMEPSTTGPGGALAVTAADEDSGNTSALGARISEFITHASSGLIGCTTVSAGLEAIVPLYPRFVAAAPDPATAAVHLRQRTQHTPSFVGRLGLVLLGYVLMTTGNVKNEWKKHLVPYYVWMLRLTSIAGVSPQEKALIPALVQRAVDMGVIDNAQCSAFMTLLRCPSLPDVDPVFNTPLIPEAKVQPKRRKFQFDTGEQHSTATSSTSDLSLMTPTESSIPTNPTHTATGPGSSSASDEQRQMGGGFGSSTGDAVLPSQRSTSQLRSPNTVSNFSSHPPLQEPLTSSSIVPKLGNLPPMLGQQKISGVFSLPFVPSSSIKASGVGNGMRGFAHNVAAAGPLTPHLDPDTIPVGILATLLKQASKRARNLQAAFVPYRPLDTMLIPSTFPALQTPSDQLMDKLIDFEDDLEAEFHSLLLEEARQKSQPNARRGGRESRANPELTYDTPRAPDTAAGDSKRPTSPTRRRSLREFRERGSGLTSRAEASWEKPLAWAQAEMGIAEDGSVIAKESCERLGLGAGAKTSGHNSTAADGLFDEYRKHRAHKYHKTIAQAHADRMQEELQSTADPSRLCFICQKAGHLARECKFGMS